MENEWETPDPVKVVALEQAVIAMHAQHPIVAAHHSEMTVSIACRFEQYLRSDAVKL